MRRINQISTLVLLLTGTAVFAQQNTDQSKFRQMGTEFPTANTYRTASGAPGESYWQQKVDYDIKVELDDEKQRIMGKEVITYTNNSPHPLTYLWLQLDQNVVHPESDTYKTATNKLGERVSAGQLNGMLDNSFDGGHKIEYVKDITGKPLKYTIVKTMMRVDLPTALVPKTGKIQLQIGWSYNINDRQNPALGADSRGGYELFPEDGNYLYTITQWFPRLAVYDDYNGWQHKQFLGQGEFTLPFGNYTVAITVPSDHIIAATGALQNAKEVLTADQLKRFEEAKTATKPVVIVTQAEATEKEKTKAKDKKTWVYKADNVRDFAFGSSRKFIWDAMGVKIEGSPVPTVMAMSYYPKEANPLYGHLSTEAVAHTLRVYSKHTIPYPYPVAISVEASNGMEYPMICFNYGRPEKDGTYSERVKYGMLGVIIHEVGHNFFPMIVNSDERQWTWMDEGLNSFCQFLAEQEWDRNFPSNGGQARNIVGYMKADKEVQNPIMTNSESIIRFGPNAYTKPATALNILRETVMGRELFDFAFREYARRWAFKHPTPYDLFRTMEDASGIDLDWYWRGWFFTTDNVDISLDAVTEFRMDTKNPEVEKPLASKKSKEQLERDVTYQNNKRDIAATAVERNEALKDFYNTYDPNAPAPTDKDRYEKYIASLGPKERAIIEAKKNYYQLDLSNEGGLVMPVILKFEFEDGTSEIQRIPAEIWRLNDKKISKVFAFAKPVKQVILDPQEETADVNVENNYYPRRPIPSRFEVFKQEGFTRGASMGSNPMQQAQQQKKTNGSN
ncbi:M1 family metallopeptidase [Haliscomenobacter hydrossis]|uniref:Aminopeptidase n=1 Tax=Haliscomenobacter hydrossis (strain ATCC 27775 / DSM 1100 / LMG 10767 / O) TaxID=760192 RepID=F4KYE4_HALH1|nr:M1 family metallopeptidase [Haliscomenobacter hydrossis]AEE49385.1 aminopeptidase [Haliscomenobacter hydrossis DSM 1100]